MIIYSLVAKRSVVPDTFSTVEGYVCVVRLLDRWGRRI